MYNRKDSSNQTKYMVFLLKNFSTVIIFYTKKIIYDSILINILYRLDIINGFFSASKQDPWTWNFGDN